MLSCIIFAIIMLMQAYMSTISLELVQISVTKIVLGLG